MSTIIASVLMLIGGIFCLVAAVGMLRLPDTLIRMHGATKAGTLGAGCILAAGAVVAGDLATTLKTIAAIVFLLLTAPVAAHLIARAAYRRGLSLYGRTWINELEGAPPASRSASPAARQGCSPRPAETGGDRQSGPHGAQGPC